MAITYVNGSSAVNGLLAVTSVNLTAPGADTGDLLIAYISIGNLGTITPPDGWDQPSEYGDLTVLTLQTRIWTRTIPDIATEPASYTWTFPSSAVAAVLEVWRGARLYQVWQDRDLLALLAHDTGVLNNNLDNVRVVSYFSGSSILALGWSPQGGDTERFDIVGGLLAVLNVNMSVADTPTVTGPGFVSRTGTSLTAVQGIAGLLLLAPKLSLGLNTFSSTALGIASGMQSRFATSFITTQAANPSLNLDDCIGQRQGTFQFTKVNIVTGMRTAVRPIENQIPTLSHDTTRTIKRTLTNLWFDQDTTAGLNPISDRIEISMTVGGIAYPLGTYMFNDLSEITLDSTGRPFSSSSLYDLGFILDQPLENAFPFVALFPTNPQPVVGVIAQMMEIKGITDFSVEPSAFLTPGAWGAGTSGMSVLNQVAIDGDYFPPWYNNHNMLRFIRSFDPVTAIPTFDYDRSKNVIAAQIVKNKDLLTAPNRFIVVSNASSDPSTAAFGVYDVPASAPHSIQNRGFVVPTVISRQQVDAFQAAAVAANIGQQQTIYERVQITTVPDPRHDSYDVVRWQGDNWLEISWSLPLMEGSSMTHLLRKAYKP